MPDYFRDDIDEVLAQARKTSAVRDQKNLLHGLTEQVRTRVVETFSASRLMHPDEEVEQTVRRIAEETVSDCVDQALARG